MLSSFIGNHVVKQPPVAVSADRPIRSLVKAFSWRVTGSIDTMLLSWFFTGDLTVAAAIGLTEVATKMVLYYLHERAWNRIPLGRAEQSASQSPAQQTGDVNALQTVSETT